MNRTLRRWLGRGVAGAAIALALLPYAPDALAFPYSVRIGPDYLASERPIPAEAATAVLARAHALIRSGPLGAQPVPPLHLYLTEGGWRWHLLSRTLSGGPFGQSRPFSTTVFLNESALERDRVRNGKAVGGMRTISGVIAHEATHIMLNHRLGVVRAALLPAWKSEGLADAVARESSLSPADVARLRASGEGHPALVYYEGRRRVEAALGSGMRVDRLLAP